MLIPRWNHRGRGCDVWDEVDKMILSRLFWFNFYTWLAVMGLMGLVKVTDGSNYYVQGDRK